MDTLPAGTGAWWTSYLPQATPREAPISEPEFRLDQYELLLGGLQEIPGSETPNKRGEIHLKDLEVLYGPRVKTGTYGSGIVIILPGTASSDYERLWRTQGWPDEVADKTIVKIHCTGRMSNQGKTADVWRCKLTDWIHRVVGWVVELARRAGVPVFVLSFSRGAMFASYLLHRRPTWFEGAMLCGGYPLWSGNDDQEKCACQLLQSASKVVIIHEKRDEYSNIKNHRHYWQRLLFAPTGPLLGMCSPRVMVERHNGSHVDAEKRSCGVHADKDQWARAWQFMEGRDEMAVAV